MDDSTEVFKQAIISTMRAISGDEDLSVSFGRGKAYLQGSKARIPLPETAISEEALASLRGTADRFALRSRFHDETLHLRNRPSTGIAQELFDWVEESRVAAIGSHLMRGVQHNLSAQLDQYCQDKGYAVVELSEDAPLGEAVGLLVREKLIGEPVPPTAQAILDPWRDYIEQRIGDRLDDLSQVIFDQSAFMDVTRELIADLGLTDDWGEEGSSDDADDSESDTEDMEPEGGDDSADPEAGQDGDLTDAIEGEVPVDMDSMDMVEADGSDDESGAPPDMLPDKSWLRPKTTDYKAYTTAFDEVVVADQ
ncbi:MAG: hypothetical protein OSB45_16205, partial [Pseudomonadales bacterium]|nr:hypothetical protein [Pseudomonadales bacterium]